MSARRRAARRELSSSTRTAWPSRTRRRTSAAPRKPVPPVTRKRLGIAGRRSEALDRGALAAEREITRAGGQLNRLVDEVVPAVIDHRGARHLRADRLDRQRLVGRMVV